MKKSVDKSFDRWYYMQVASRERSQPSKRAKPLERKVEK